jgi:drug/metabolite transporter (DMT)-like permease
LIRKGVRPGDADNGVFVTTIFNVVVFTIAVVFIAFTGSLPAWNTAGVLWFIAAGIVTTFLGRNALFGGISRIGSSRTASIKNTNPIVSVAIAVLFLGERLPLLAVVGAGITFFGLFLLVYEAYRQREMGPKQTGEEDVADIALESEALAEGGPPQNTSAAPVAMIGTLLAVCAAVFFGTGQTLRAVGIEYMPNAFLGAMIGSWTALFSYLAMQVALGNLQAVSKNSFGSFRLYFWLAGIGTSIGQIGFFIAVTFAPVSQVVVITASETLLTLVLAAIFVRQFETVSRRVVVAASAVFIGGVIVSYF